MRLAWLPLPDDDPVFFGFEGSRARTAAHTMNEKIRSAVREISILAEDLWNRILAAQVRGDSPKQVQDVVTLAIEEMTTASRTSWFLLSRALTSFEDVDMIPGESRAAISAPFRQLYRQLSGKVDAYVSGRLRLLYAKLANDVITFYRGV